MENFITKVKGILNKNIFLKIIIVAQFVIVIALILFLVEAIQVVHENDTKICELSQVLDNLETDNKYNKTKSTDSSQQISILKNRISLLEDALIENGVITSDEIDITNY